MTGKHTPRRRGDKGLSVAVILVLTDDAGNVVGIEKRLNTKSTSILT